MQPFSTQNQQQMTFRYFDSKRPLVVSFRRINKITQNNFTLEHCNTISDIHRIDVGAGATAGGGGKGGNGKMENGHDKMTLKTLQKYGVNNVSLRNGMTKCNNTNLYSENQSCRNFNYMDKHKAAHFQAQYGDDDEIYDENRLDKVTVTYPKEKFYGNAKLMFTMNDDDMLRKRRIDSVENDDEFILNAIANNCSHERVTSMRKMRDRNNHRQQQNLSRNSKYDNALTTFSRMMSQGEFKNNPSHLRRNEKAKAENETRKCTSTPMLNISERISQFPSTFEFDDSETKKDSNFVSILNVKRKKAVLVRNSKSC